MVAAMTAIWLFWMTQRPNPEVATQLQPITSAATMHGLSAAFVIGIIGNILVFIPFGMGVSAATDGRIGPAMGWGALVSLTIEWLQAQQPSRVPSLLDFALNMVGVALGAFIVYLTFKKIWRHHD